MNDKIRVRNIETGQVGWIRRRLFENPRINNGILVEVDERSKPFVPELYKSKKIEEPEVPYTEEEDVK